MNEIIVCVAMNLKRCRSNIMGTLVTVILLPVFIIGIAVAGKDNHVGKIAICNGNQHIFEYLDENNIIYQVFDIKELKQKKLEGSGEYLGYISYDIAGNVMDYGTYIKKGEIIEQVVDQTYRVKKEDINFLQNIVPVLVSLIFLESVLNMKLYLKDRHIGMMARLKVLGIKNQAYCFATLLYTWLFMFVPIMISFLIVRYGLKVDFEFSFLSTIIFIGVTIILGSLCAFSLCSVISNEASAIMVGNVLAVITSIISGLFGEWDKLKVIGNIMPQKILLNWMNSFSYNKPWNISLYVVVAYILILYVFVLQVNNRRFEK